MSIAGTSRGITRADRGVGIAIGVGIGVGVAERACRTGNDDHPAARRIDRSFRSTV